MVTRFAQTIPHDATARESRVPDTAVSWDASKNEGGASTESQSMTHRSFEKDILWMERNKRDMQSNPLPRILAIVVLVGALLVAGNTLVVNATDNTAADRPDYQSPLTIQNLWENAAAYTAYRNPIQQEWLDSTDSDLDLLLLQELYSNAADYYAFLNTQAYPSGECAQDFFFAAEKQATYDMLVFSAFIHNMTATAGTPVDIEVILYEYDSFTEALGQGIVVSERCINKVDL